MQPPFTCQAGRWMRPGSPRSAPMGVSGPPGLQDYSTKIDVCQEGNLIFFR